MAGKVKVAASGTENDGGTVVTVTGADRGGHTASVRFLEPDYGPSFYRFDGGDDLVVRRDGEHGSVIVVLDDVDEHRVDVEPFAAPKKGK